MKMIARLMMVAGLFLLMQGAAVAERLDIIVSGKSYHVNAESDWNEDNWGAGLEYEFRPRSRWIKYLVANGFRDSMDEMSYMAGGGLKRRFGLTSSMNNLYLDLGLVGFLMTRTHVNDNRPFPGVLPTLTFGNDHVALNATYVPGVVIRETTWVPDEDDDMSGVFFLQLKIRADAFMPGGRDRYRRAGSTESGTIRTARVEE